jgi:hypothetical protein
MARNFDLNAHGLQNLVPSHFGDEKKEKKEERGDGSLMYSTSSHVPHEQHLLSPLSPWRVAAAASHSAAPAPGLLSP